MIWRYLALYNLVSGVVVFSYKPEHCLGELIDMDMETSFKMPSSQIHAPRRFFLVVQQNGDADSSELVAVQARGCDAGMELVGKKT